MICMPISVAGFAECVSASRRAANEAERHPDPEPGGAAAVRPVAAQVVTRQQHRTEIHRDPQGDADGVGRPVEQRTWASLSSAPIASTARRSETRPAGCETTPPRFGCAGRRVRAVSLPRRRVESAKSRGVHCGATGVKLVGSRSATSNIVGHGGCGRRRRRRHFGRHRVKFDDPPRSVEKQLVHPRDVHRRIAAFDTAGGTGWHQFPRTGPVPERHG